MSAPLTNSQKRYLSQLARRAWRQSPDADPQDEATYRHTQVAQAAGKLGLRCCGQDDYNRVKAHFLHLLGEDGAALNAHVRAETEPRRLAEFKLLQACEEFGLHLSYADAICRRQNRGLGLGDVGPKTLWHLMFTIRNRGRQKQKQAA
jgi:hypothetical protein